MRPSPRFPDFLNMVLGVWLILSPWVLGYANANDWTTPRLANAWWAGVVIFIIALAAASFPRALWLEWCNVILGAWVVVSPWILGFTDHPLALWNAIVVGLLVAILALMAHWLRADVVSPGNL